MGPPAYLVAYAFMAKQILDFLRVKNNDGPSRICYRNYIYRILVHTCFASGVHVEEP